MTDLPQTRQLWTRGFGVSAGTLGWSFGPVLVVLAAAAIANHQLDRVRTADLLRDPATVAELPWYTGALSNLGILLWCTAASVCFFGAALLCRVESSRHQVFFLLAFGGLTTALLIDDLLLIHEEVLPSLVSRAEFVMVFVYAAVVTLIVATFRHQILARGAALLLISFSLLDFSVTFDVAHDIGVFWIADSSIRFLIEDGAKLLGITAWLVYAVTATMTQIRLGAAQEYQPETSRCSQVTIGSQQPTHSGPFAFEDMLSSNGED